MHDGQATLDCLAVHAEAQPDVPGPAEAASGELLREQVHSALDQLTEKERKVLEMRFGQADVALWGSFKSSGPVFPSSGPLVIMM